LPVSPSRTRREHRRPRPRSRGRLRPLEDKRRYRQYKARTEQLPADYRTTIDALQRYMQVFGPSDKADSLLAMLEDLADLFEQSAADATPIRDVVGEDPAEFVEAFLANYPGGQWINRERQRLRDAIDRATGDKP
jgi:DNA-binding ferritin-like protein (Dps family)